MGEARVVWAGTMAWFAILGVNGSEEGGGEM